LLKLAKVSRLYRIFKVFRLLKIAKFVRHNEAVNDFIDQIEINPSFLRMLKLFIQVIFIVHLMGCMWFFNATLIEQSWVSDNGFEDESIMYKYFVSIYWATQTITTVGYGDIAIIDISEYILATLSMIFGVSLYTYLVGSISQIIAKMDDKAFFKQS
jgi:hyperpolarization activated cyclic nucleotide-gated potassium channel 1